VRRVFDFGARAGRAIVEKDEEALVIRGEYCNSLLNRGRTAPLDAISSEGMGNQFRGAKRKGKRKKKIAVR
jgi:hypothetical protein